jgi:hypothetical protein
VSWDPGFFIENNGNELKESAWYIVQYDGAGRATVFQKRRTKGTFCEKIELNDYPFDSQV